MKSRRILLLLLALLAGGIGVLSAEPRGGAHPLSIGFSGGVQSLGFDYSFTSDSSYNFHSVNAFLDIQGMSWGKVSMPGGYLRYDYNFCIGKTGRTLFYAGPGAMLGYVTDSDGSYGAVLGLAASVGIRHKMARRVLLGLSLHPTLAYKLNWESGRQHLRIYEAGLWHSVLPEISVAYCLGCNKITKFDASKRRYRFSLESAFAPCLYNYVQSMYFAADGYRSHEEISASGFQVAGELLLGVSWLPSDSWKLSMLLGYAGVRTETRIHEALLRGTGYFRPVNESGDRFFWSLDLGCGLDSQDFAHPFAVGKLGVGYRIQLSRESGLEFFLRSTHAFATPTLYDETGTEVPASQAIRSRLYATGLSLGAAIEL